MLLEVNGLKKYFRVPSKTGLFGHETVKAVDGVDLKLERGQILGIVGESGCGKSSLGRSILRLLEPDEGNIFFEGQDWLALKGETLRKQRSQMQMVFQDPYASLNPRMRIGEAIGEPLIIHGGQRGKAIRDKVAELLERVGLHASMAERFPHEFSGGQRQRIGIARAMACGPKILIADEPVSSLDISIQAQILNLLKDLQQQTQMAILFIAHDLRVVEYMSDQVAVMYKGRIVEFSSGPELYKNPLHPYTRSLLAAVPAVPGELKGPQLQLEPHDKEIENGLLGPLKEVSSGHWVAGQA